MSNRAYLRLFLLALAFAALIGSWAALKPPAPAGVSAEVIALQHESDANGFRRAFEPRPFVFPADHGPHPEYQTEWWYYTGNLQADSKRFGYQLTFFRRAIAAGAPARNSDWATDQIYFAHFAITDASANRHASTERFSRGAAGLAGATGAPFRVWLDDWSVQSLNADGSAVRLRASDSLAGSTPVTLDLALRSTKPAALHGEAGLSRKSSLPGNASYYFSYTRLETEGNIVLDGQALAVSGLSWMDHEFGTTGLGPDATGWDWFSLQLNDGRELMLFQIRQKDGSIEPLSSGTLIGRDGSSKPLPVANVQLKLLDRWRSPRTGATYPAGWSLIIPSEGLTLTVRPLIADQEMDVSFKYWEGAVVIEGTSKGDPVSGSGFVELTGYSTPAAR